MHSMKRRKKTGTDPGHALTGGACCTWSTQTPNRQMPVPAAATEHSIPSVPLLITNVGSDFVGNLFIVANGHGQLLVRDHPG